jgi:hypothetical protein
MSVVVGGERTGSPAGSAAGVGGGSAVEAPAGAAAGVRGNWAVAVGAASTAVATGDALGGRPGVFEVSSFFVSDGFVSSAFFVASALFSGVFGKAPCAKTPLTDRESIASPTRAPVILIDQGIRRVMDLDRIIRNLLSTE